MNNKQIKFRQPLFHNGKDFASFHYWGYDEDQIFTAPWGLLNAMEKQKGSEMLSPFKDKTGVVIYAGDIIVVTHTEGLSWPTTKKDKGVCEFSNGSFSVKCIHPGKSNAKEISKRYFHLHFNDKRKFEVIGNIHQNPELI